MVFVKAMKGLALGIATLPIAGCAIGLGLIYSSYIQALSFAPDLDNVLFSQTMIGFALVETFLVISVALFVVIALL